MDMYREKLGICIKIINEIIKVFLKSYLILLPSDKRGK